MKTKTNYCKMAVDKIEYHGERYFKYSAIDDKVVQVCVTTSQVKKGKSNTFGVYLISKLTLFSNHLAYGYAIPCTKKEYEKNFNKVINFLK